MKVAVNEVKNETEIRIFQDALSASGWNRRRAAANLNISYRTMLYKIQQHGLTHGANSSFGVSTAAAASHG
jgi:two-component system response regulator AtoC